MPQRIPSGDSTRFEQAHILREVERSLRPPLLTGAGRAPVKVAVLDTWPMGDGTRGPMAQIASFYDSLRVKGITSQRLHDVVTGRIVPESRIYDYIRDTPLRNVLCAQRIANGGFEIAYRMADHGLFITDIINEIAPEAEISVYRVLGDFGTSDFDTVARTVEEAIGRAAGVPLILNLSMGFAPELPMVNEFLADPVAVYLNASRWARRIVTSAPNASTGRGGRRSDGANSNAKELVRHQRALWALEFLFNFDERATRVLPVAAAGNDSDRRRGQVWGPRLPAATNGVFGVAALNRQGNLTAYSNDPPDRGISAFGGEVDQSTGRTRDGIVGLYTSPELPPGRGDGNRYGWAMWAGTSFATPVVAGLTARLWSETPTARADEVRNAIVTNVDGSPRRVLPLISAQ
jgi:hypothetical protein